LSYTWERKGGREKGSGRGRKNEGNKSSSLQLVKESESQGGREGRREGGTMEGREGGREGGREEGRDRDVPC